MEPLNYGHLKGKTIFVTISMKISCAQAFVNLSLPYNTKFLWQETFTAPWQVIILSLNIRGCS